MDQHGERGAFEFTGSWRDYAPIAFTNLLLTIVTLGIYNFWARTRTRQYLWSHTRFIDDQLEWTGTGLELLIGYVLVMVLLFLPLGGIQLLMGVLAAQGTMQAHLAVFFLAMLFYVVLLGLGGVAIFRALRYRLSRTYWHGIRGGSDDQGFRYGLSYLWRTMLGGIAFGLLVPWSLVTLWNKRWNAMSFGPFRFVSRANTDGLMGRYLLFYLLPIALVLGVVASLGIATAVSVHNQSPTPIVGFAIFAVLLYLAFFVLLGLVATAFYAAYFRKVISGLSLGDLEFEFTASTKEWLKLIFGTAALVVCTLGVGAVFIAYRNWAFFVRHLRAYGTLELDQFTQSTTRAPGQGEGLFDSFDMGAF
ncbi:YjgN family protein [uncultured Sphingomonas sp.]|uniref:YjgN family protein n=1 Tax=uncultured Sphingomonas sp. TaxID=158754 RepID=UPI0025F9A6F6|nr:YjgN family protein [uncultured Sphingomonas sp.]